MKEVIDNELYEGILKVKKVDRKHKNYSIFELEDDMYMEVYKMDLKVGDKLKVVISTNIKTKIHEFFDPLNLRMVTSDDGHYYANDIKFPNIPLVEDYDQLLTCVAFKTGPNVVWTSAGGLKSKFKISMRETDIIYNLIKKIPE